MNPQFLIKTLGCKVNQVESESVLSELYSLGWTSTSDVNQAKIAILNTCSVTHEADAKTRKAIRKLASSDSVKRVYVTGCSAVMHRDTLSQINEKVSILEDKTKIAQTVAADFTLDDEQEFAREADSNLLHTRAFIKVQDGCENFCSYCIVPYARGASRSVPFSQVLTQVNSALERKAREIVLTGINIGRYQDMDHSIDSLEGLLAALLKTPVERIRISSIEPPDVTPQFIETFCSNKRICPHIHLPLQSGSDSVLERMNRRYSTEEYAGLVDELRAKAPNLALTTDVIVGFPGETEAEFEETLAFCKQMNFSKIHVFKYSVRPGTPAADMEKVPPDRISKRAARLRVLSEEMRESFARSFTNKPVELLVERIEDGFISGTSGEYIAYRLPYTEAMLDAQVEVGSIVEVIG